MSFITRCPSCGTAFRVVPDQLRISEGWVRCGHCQQVFDATLDLQPWWPGTAEVALKADAAAEPAATDAPSSQSSEPVLSLQVQEDRPLEPEAAAPDAERLADEAAPRLEPQGEVAPPGPDAEPMAHGAGEAPQPAFEAVPDVQALSPAAETIERSPAWPLHAESDTAPSLSFVRQAEQRARWRRPVVRAGLAVSTLGLGLLLSGQILLHWRDALAARVPALTPLLQSICRPLQCEVRAPRQIDSVQIDTSTLQRSAPGQYTFEVVLKNTASLTVLTPALELTLTDANDRVLLRRVFLADEWPQPLPTLPAASEHTVRLDWQLDDPLAQSLSGYRALLFYP